MEKSVAQHLSRANFFHVLLWKRLMQRQETGEATPNEAASNAFGSVCVLF
jgi:hypothetical protein